MSRKPDKPPKPDDLVRFTALMTRSDRARLKSFCARTMEEMEVVGARWIMERLSDEERKQSRPR